MESGTTTVATTAGTVTTPPAGTTTPVGTAPATTTPAPAAGSTTSAGSTTPAGHAAHTHPLAAHAALLQAHAHAVTKVTPIAPPAVHTSFVQNLQNWALNWEPVVAILFFVVIIAVMWRMLKVMPKVKPQQIKPASHQAVGWKDIAGVDDARGELEEIVEFLRDPKKFEELGAKVPKGILLHGPPGTGKTLLAKAVAHESGAQFFAQSAAAFVEMFAGLGAARIRRLFAIARKHEPAIIFIDELDAVGGRRGMDISGEKDQTLNQLLVEMDGFAASGRVVVIAASNLLDKLDPALLRPGRFDRQVFVAPPDVRGREGVLGVHTREKPLGKVDLSLVAQQTSGLTGADLANICNEAAIFATRRGAKRIDDVDFDSALERVIAGVQSRRVLNDHEKRVVAYHEAGHALCGELLPSVDRVHKISIVPRGRALGYTLNLPGGGPLPEDARGAARLHDRLAGRPSSRAGRVRRDHDGRLRRPEARRRHLALDGARLRDGDRRRRPRARRGRAPVGDDAADPRRGAPGSDRGSPARGAADARRPPRPARRARDELLEHEVLDRDAIDRIMKGVPRLERGPGTGLRVVAAATAVDATPGEGGVGAG